MARRFKERDTSVVLAAAEQWIDKCLIQDGSVFRPETSLWTLPLIDEVYHAFVEHPDLGDSDFMTKLKKQLKDCSAPAKHLAAEMLWVLLLFPSNVKPSTKQPKSRNYGVLVESRSHRIIVSFKTISFKASDRVVRRSVLTVPLNLSF